MFYIRYLYENQKHLVKLEKGDKKMKFKKWIVGLCLFSGFMFQQTVKAEELDRPANAHREYMGVVEVTVDNLNMRNSNNPSAPVTQTLPKGSKWVVWGNSNGMFQIALNGWITVNNAYVSYKPYKYMGMPVPKIESPVAKPSNAPANATGIVEVKAWNSYMRSAGTLESPVTQFLPHGSKWMVSGSQNGMYKIGANGWINSGNEWVSYTPFAESVGESVQGVATLKQAVNIRTAPSWTAPTTRVLEKGSAWKVWKKTNDFYNVGGDQWIPATSDFVTFTADGAQPPVVNQKKGTVVVDDVLNVRDSSSASGKIVGKLYNGDTVDILGEANGWYNLRKGSLVGWSNKNYINVNGGTVQPPAGNGSLANKKITIDAGHGGDDPGSIGLDKTSEQWINLQFAMKIRDELKNAGATVYMVRESDRSCNNMPKSSAELQCRVNLGINTNSDLFISVHSNSYMNTSAKGIETFYDTSTNGQPTKSKKLANLVHAQVKQVMNTTDRGAKNYDYYVLRKNPKPAILIETGFLTNSGDLAQLKSPTIHNSFAKAVKTGVSQYFAS